MKIFYALFFAFFAFVGFSQAPLFHVDGTAKNRVSGKPESGVKVEMVQSGATLFSVVTTSSGKYDLKGNVDYKVPFKIVFSKSGFVSKTLAFDYSKMNVEDAPPGEFRPVRDADFEMVPSDPNMDLSFLNSEPVGKFYWDEQMLEPNIDRSYNARIKAKIEKIIVEAEKKNPENDAKFQELVAAADILFNQQKWEEARTKYEDANMLKPTERHPIDRMNECDALILAKKKEELNNQNADTEYLNLIAAADALRDQKKFEQAILKYEEAIRKKNEDYPNDQVAELRKLIENDKKYKEAVTQADMFYTQRSYDAAKDKYTIANKLKPTEPHPIARLAEIDKKKNEQSAANEKKQKYEDAVNAADALFDEKKYDEAKVKYNEALDYESGATYPVERIKECDKLIAAALLDKQKQEKVAKLLEEGNTFFVASKWNDSKAKYNAVLAEDIGNSVATARLEEIALKIKEEGDVAALELKFNKLVIEGDLAAKGTKYVDAESKYQSALDLKQDIAVQAKLDDVKKKIKDLEEVASKEKRFQELKAEGMQMAADQKWLEAKSTLTEAQDLKADAQIAIKLKEIEEKVKANEALSKIEKEYLELITAAQQKESTNDIDGAIVKYKEASLKKPSETLPKERITALEELKKNSAKQNEINAKFNAAMQQGKDLMSDQKYLEAIKEFNLANSLRQEEQEPISLAAECERLEKAKGNEADQLFEKMLSTAQTKLEEKDYSKARELADRAAKLRVSDPKPKELLERINSEEATEKNYLAKIVEAEKEVASKNYSKAILIFGQAKIIKPSETRPQQRIDELNELIANASSVAEKEALYKDFITKGALSEGAKGWEQALIHYKNALNVKEGDLIAQNKINEIQQILDDQANASRIELERQENFNKLIEEADLLFKEGDYLNAKSRYESALELIPSNTYAKGQSDECLRREQIRSIAEEELGYRKVIEKGDENFALKDFEKAKDYYNRAIGMRSTDSYPKGKLDEIDAILNPKIVGSVDLKPLGVPYPENSIIDGYAALVQADIERKSIKDERIVNVVNNSIGAEKAIGDAKIIQQKETSNEIVKIVNSISLSDTESDLNRDAIVQALREAENEYAVVDSENLAFKQAELNQAQDRIHSVAIETEIDYSNRDGVYFDNSNKLHSYDAALRMEMNERISKDGNLNIDSDQKLTTAQSKLQAISTGNSDKQKLNDEMIENVVITAEVLEKERSETKGDDLLGNNLKLVSANDLVAQRVNEDSKLSPENQEKLKNVEAVVIDAEKVRNEVSGGRNEENQNILDLETIKIEEDFSDRDISRKENVELVKENEYALTAGVRETLEKENLKYLENKNIIIQEEQLNVGVSKKADDQVALNITGVQVLTNKANDNYEVKAMSDDEQRMGTRSGVETINANSQEYTIESTTKQEQNALVVNDINKAVEAGLTNREETKKDELLDAQKSIEGIESKKPERIKIKNALGQDFPEGVSQESFTQNDENGLMKAIITRRIVVINGEGNVYVRTQTLQSITYSKNNEPITEHTWNKETTGPNLQKNY